MKMQIRAALAALIVTGGLAVSTTSALAGSAQAGDNWRDAPARSLAVQEWSGSNCTGSDQVVLWMMQPQPWATRGAIAPDVQSIAVVRRDTATQFQIGACINLPATQETAPTPAPDGGVSAWLLALVGAGALGTGFGIARLRKPSA